METKYIPYLLFVLVIASLAGVALVPQFAEYFKHVAELTLGAFLGLFVKSPLQ